MLPLIRHGAGLLVCIAFAACTTQQYSYIQRAHQGTPKPGEIDYHATPALDDVVAINFANSVTMAMRSRLTGARISREVSNTLQIGLAAFGGAGAALGTSATTLTVLGLGSAGVPELQRIFNARDRAEAYRDAARLIDEAVLEYYSFNPSPREEQLTPNGVTLLHRTMAAIHMVEQSLTGQLPTLQDMAQATERMSAAGSVPHQQGDLPPNFINASGDAPLGKLTLTEIKGRKHSNVSVISSRGQATPSPGHQSISIPREFRVRNRVLRESYHELTEGKAAEALTKVNIARDTALTAKQQVALEILKEGGFKTDIFSDPADTLQHHRERAVTETSTANLEKGFKKFGILKSPPKDTSGPSPAQKMKAAFEQAEPAEIKQVLVANTMPVAAEGSADEHKNNKRSLAVKILELSELAEVTEDGKKVGPVTSVIVYVGEAANNIMTEEKLVKAFKALRMKGFE
jgi:hypothetical protein